MKKILLYIKFIKQNVYTFLFYFLRFFVVILLFLCVIPLWDSAVAHSHSGKELSPPMTLQKRHLLMSSYITSQFNYCPLVWLIHNIKLNKKINKVHERALRIVYGDHKTKFSELLNIDKSVIYIKETCNIYLLKSIKLKRVSRLQ